MLCELQLTKEEEARLDQYYHNLCKGVTITPEMLVAMTPKKTQEAENEKPESKSTSKKS